MTGNAKKRDEEQSAAAAVAQQYPVRITPHIESLIEKHGADSAIGRQYLPDIRELSTTPDESPDPTGDQPHTPVNGIVHRHGDRVLLKPLHACAVYCRFVSAATWSGRGKMYWTKRRCTTPSRTSRTTKRYGK